MKTKIQRVNRLIGYLIFIGKLPINSIQKEISNISGANKVSVSRALKGNEEYLTDSFIERLNNSFGSPFNSDWLLKGKGDMLLNTENINIENSPQAMANTGTQGDYCQQINGISEESLKNVLSGFQNIMNTHNQQTEKLISVINNLVEKYGK